MAKKITIAEFNIESKDVYARIAELKKLIAELKEEQKKLKASSKENTEEYAKTEVQVKSLSTQLNGQIKLGKDIIESKKSQNSILNELNLALNKEATTIKELNRQNKELVTIRNQLNLKTVEGSKSIATINSKIDQNNAIIKNNSTALERLKFNIGNYTESIVSAISQTNLFGSALTYLTNGYLAVATAIGFTIKNSIDLQDRLADVKRTTNLSWKELEYLNDKLSDINTRTSKNELLGLAEVAGKLGIEGVNNILGFVKAADKVNVSLGKAIGNSEQTLNDIGKLVDILNLKERFGIEKSMLMVGSAINSLGLASTANEAYIVEFSKRFAPIGIQANMTAADIFALGATFDQLGLESEMSASALGRFMQKIGTDIPRFAKIAGMSTKEFSKLLKEDASAALIAVLGNLKSYGGGLEELTKKLELLGINEIREKTAISALVNGINIYTDTLKISNKETAKASSVIEQFAIRNETAAASFSKLWNRIVSIVSNSGVAEFFGLIAKSIYDQLGGIELGLKYLKDSLGFKTELENADNSIKKVNKSVKQNSINIAEQIEIQKKQRENSKSDLEFELEKMQRLNIEGDNFNKKRLDAENKKAKSIANIQRQLVDYTELSEHEKSHKLQLIDIDLKNKLAQNNKQYHNYLVSERKKEADEAVATAKKELDNFIAANKSKLDNTKFFSKEYLSEEIDRQTKIYERQKDFENQKYELGISTAQEYALALDAIDIEFANKKQDLINTQKEAEISRLSENLALEAEIMQLSLDNEYDKKVQSLEQKRLAEIASAEKTGADINLINKKYALATQAIEREKAVYTANIYANLFGQLKQIAGENTVLNKAAAIAEATIATYVSAVNAYEAAAKIDPLVLAPVMAGLAITAGLANVAKISDVKLPEFAEGGIISGNSNIPVRPNGDDMLITAKRGEVILNKRQQNAIGIENLALANVPGFASGGVIGSNISYNSYINNASPNYSLFNAIIDKINTTKIVAVVDDIDTALYNNKVLINSARL